MGKEKKRINSKEGWNRDRHRDTNRGKAHKIDGIKENK